MEIWIFFIFLFNFYPHSFIYKCKTENTYVIMTTNNNTTTMIGVSLNKENALQSLKHILQFNTVEPQKFPDSGCERWYSMLMSNKRITRKDSDSVINFSSFIPIYKSGLIKSMPYNADGSKPPCDYIFETKNKMLYTFEGVCYGLSDLDRNVKILYKPTLVIGFSKNDNTKPLEEQQYLHTHCFENMCRLQITIDDKLCYQYIGDAVFNDIIKEKTINYIKHISANILRCDVKMEDIKILER